MYKLFNLEKIKNEKSKNHLNLFFDQISLISQKIDLSKLEKLLN